MKLHKQKNQLLILILTVGFFIGIFYENIVSKSQGMYIQIFQSYFLNRYAQINIIVEEYLWYVMQIRVVTFFVICILGCLRWRKIMVSVVVGWTGFLSGVLTVSAVMQLGIKGIFFCLCILFPHTICYGLVYGILLQYLFRYPEKQWNSAKTIFVILTMFLGIILETYINPLIVKMVIRFM